MNYIFSFILLVTSLGGLHSIHEFHVSKCLVEYKAENEEIQVSMNIFIDDLEIALKTLGVDSLYIGTEKEAEEADKYIDRYLGQAFTVMVNDQEKAEWQFIGKEISEDLSSIWCYLSIPAEENIEALFVKNSILLETYDDQKNITSIIGPEKKKTSFMGTRGDDEKMISY